MTTAKAPRASAKPRTGTRGCAVRAARCRHTYYLAVIVLIVLSSAGIARVALTTEAARAAFAADALQDSIKAEQLEGDMLEINRSSLSTPSRIEAVACATMQMSEAADVRYLNMPATCVQPEIDLDSAAVQPTEEVAADMPAAMPGEADEPETAKGGLVRAVLELAAGEAQVLLVGDVGLSSSR